MEYINPRNDGLDHINAWSKGETSMGRQLSNFAHTPFTHPRYGPFKSVEGFWYWVKTGMQHDHLRELWGYIAKKEGSKLPIVNCTEFEDIIREGLYSKITQTHLLSERLAGSTLPICHYYWYGDLPSDKYVVVVPISGLFQMEFIADLRQQIKLT